MPFQDSIISGTQAHKHESSSATGGFLETGATGITNMSEGSIGYYNSSSVLQELVKPVTPAGEVLTFATSGTSPSWASAGGVSTNSLSASLASGTWTTSSTSAVAVTGMSVTATGTGGLIIANANASINDAVGNRHGIWVASAGSVSTATGVYNSPNDNDTDANSTTLSIARASQAIAVYANTQGGTVQWNGGTAQGGCNIMVSEIS